MQLTVISSYFGRVPPYFQLWLDSVGTNAHLHWIFYTDCELSSFSIPENMKVVLSSFNQMRDRLRRMLGYEPNYHCAWDICKFKVVFGTVFADVLKDADYWAWTDCDMIYGDLAMATRFCFEGFDKILPKGHFSLIRNDKRIADAIAFDSKVKSILEDGDLVSNSGCLDEEELRFELLPKLGATQQNDVPYVNFYPRHGHFQLQDALPLCRKLGYSENPIPGLKLPCVFTWKDGKLVGWFAMPNGQVHKEECVYIHFFKRDLTTFPNRLDSGKAYLIIPNRMDEYDGHELTWKEISRLDRWRVHWRYYAKRMNMKTILRKLGV